MLWNVVKCLPIHRFQAQWVNCSKKRSRPRFDVINRKSKFKFFLFVVAVTVVVVDTDVDDVTVVVFVAVMFLFVMTFVAVVLLLMLCYCFIWSDNDWHIFDVHLLLIRLRTYFTISFKKIFFTGKVFKGL